MSSKAAMIDAEALELLHHVGLRPRRVGEDEDREPGVAGANQRIDRGRIGADAVVQHAPGVAEDVAIVAGDLGKAADTRRMSGICA